MRSNGGVPEAYIFRRGAIMVAISECLTLRVDGRGLSAMDTYRSLVMKKSGRATSFRWHRWWRQLFLIDCRSDEGAVYIWWHDVPDQNLLDLRVGIADCWSCLAAD